MISITEPKIASLEPRWAPFPGFSLLFDNPGRPFRREGDLENLVGDRETGFYRGLSQGLQSLQVDPSYLLCPLPPASYHVTAFDVANQGDLPDPALAPLLDGVPSGSWVSDHPILRPAVASPLVAEEWNLQFAYGELAPIGPYHALLVLLQPLNAAEFARFLEARRVLSRAYRSSFGFGAGENFHPHVSLGYFANLDAAGSAAENWDRWNETLKDHAGEEVLAFRSSSLYAFSDMATFQRKSAISVKET